MEQDEATFLPTDDIIEEFDCEDAVSPDTPEDDFDITSDHGSHGSVDYDDVQYEGEEPTFSVSFGGSNEVYAVEYWNDYLVTGGQDDCVRFFTRDRVEGTLEVQMEDKGTDSVSCIKGKGQYVAVGWVDGSLSVYMLKNKQPELYARMQDTEGEIVWINWHKTDTILFGANDGSVWSVSIVGNELQVNGVFSGNNLPSTAGIVTEKDTLITGDERGTVFIFSIPTLDLKRKFQVSSSVVSILHTTNRLLLSTVDGQVYVIGDDGQGAPKLVLSADSDSIEQLVYSKYGNCIVIGSLSGRLIMLDPSTMNVKQDMTFGYGICHVRVVEDQLLLGSDDGRLFMISTGTGELSRSFATNSAPIHGVCVDTHARELAICTGDGSVHIYSI